MTTKFYCERDDHGIVIEDITIYLDKMPSGFHRIDLYQNGEPVVENLRISALSEVILAKLEVSYNGD